MIELPDSEGAFRQVYQDLKQKGQLCSPRGQKVIELEHYTYQLPAYVRFPSFESRKFKLNYVKEEFLWYLRGNRQDLSIMDHASMWSSLLTKDPTTDKPQINSNYGQYIFAGRDNHSWGHTTPFDKAVKTLTDDKDSRRASIMILQPYHLVMATNDVPCTYSLNFRIRSDKLNMSVHMRSQDAVFGMGNDAPTFSFIHEMMYVALKAVYPELQLGTYTHTADSFHVYERHFEMLERISSGDRYINIDAPKISGPVELSHIRFGLHTLYPGGDRHWNYRRAEHDFEVTKRACELFGESIDAMDGTFAFSNWLLDAPRSRVSEAPSEDIPNREPKFDPAVKPVGTV